MMGNGGVVLLVVVVLLSDVNASPFELIDKYIEDFGNGMNIIKKVSEEYEYHQRHCDETKYNETHALLEAEEFDFIIVGGGTAGAVIANRLSEVPEWKILLLESGPPETPETQVPAMHSYLQNTAYNWHFQTTPQKTACLCMKEQRCLIPKGNALGGSSSINNMIFTRGNPKDYGTWADLGNEGWCYLSAFPYFVAMEDAFVEQMDRKHHHHGGKVHLENPHHSYKGLNHHIFEAAHELGIKKIDYNGKHQIGFGLPQLTTKSGKRYSVAKAYLEPAHDRDNLIVRPLSHVIKIIISEHTKETQGVKYIHDDKLFIAKARKEVILSAGAINTPHLLKLSGIGPKEELEKLEIPVVESLNVGHNLKDRVAFIGLNFLVNTSHPVDEDHHAVVLNYLRSGLGPLSYPDIEALGFIKTDVSKDPTDYPDVELLFTSNIYNHGYSKLRHTGISPDMYNAIYKPVEGHDGFTIVVILNHPKSRGSVILHDKDPYHYPLIDWNQLSDEDDHDIETMVAGVETALKLVHTESMQHIGATLIKEPIPGCEKYEIFSKDYWACAIRHLTVSQGDVSGTAQMGPKTDPHAVVDNKLKVYGVHKLRVADASVIPVPITGHLMAPTIMIGEKAADLIKKDWH